MSQGGMGKNSSKEKEGQKSQRKIAAWWGSIQAVNEQKKNMKIGRPKQEHKI